MGHVQLDVEVVFEYPDTSAASVLETGALNDHFDCSKGGSAHHGILGPFGLLVLTDNNFQEQTDLLFYISQTGGGQWTTTFCSDQSRYGLIPKNSSVFSSQDQPMFRFLEPTNTT
jgi:beta-fructofuranosidase